MNIQEIIFTNDPILLTKYEINIKIFLLDLIKKNLLDNQKYEDIINFFILRKDKNFCDSLNNLEICNILYNCLNNPHTSNIFNSNQIIISKSLDIFNNLNDYSNYSNYNHIEFLNLNSDIYSNQNLIKIQLVQLDENNINKSLEILDKIYSAIINENSKIFTRMYENINQIIQLNKMELKNRISEIITIFKLIYKLVLKDNLKIDELDINEFINMISIISIIKLKIDDLLKSKNILDIDLLILNDKESLVEVLKIFNENELDINQEAINNIKGVLKKYNKIIEILNISDDPIKNIEELYEEYQQYIQLEKISINNIDCYIIDFIINIKEYLQLIDNIDDSLVNVDSVDNEAEEIKLDILFELNKSIIELFQEIKNDSNVQVYYNRSDECNVNSIEYAYLKYEINKIENLLDDIFFEKFNEICYINLKKNNLARKINKLINLQSILEKNLNSENGLKTIEDIQLINEELTKEVNNNNLLLEQHKSLLNQKINLLKN